MPHNKVDCATTRTASIAGMSGKGTADRSIAGLRISETIIKRFIGGGLLVGTLAILPIQATADDNHAFLPAGFIDVSTLASNGDQNPYGVAFVPRGFPAGGPLSPGDILVSNFNNAGTAPAGNIQGTGTTITRVAPDGETSTFFTGVFQSPTDGGLTTALGVLKRGFVVVGQLPNSNGTAEPGSLLFLDKNGTHVLKYTNLQGPWDLAIDDDFDHAKIFVSNVLSGTVVRLDVTISPSTVTVNSVTEIAHGYGFTTNPAAFVVGPTGLAFDEERDVLYVASSVDNEIFKIQHAEATNISVLQGDLVYNDPVHLHNPLGLALTPNGHLLTANGDSLNPPVAPQLPSQIVEFTKDGHFVGELSVDSNAGAAFGIAVERKSHDTARLAAVNDDDNTIIVLRLNAGNSE
ncbi:MAG: hypothetical protein JO308_18670 [Verrucomicrobia bacterium]|nr:hypothetical protein [Verrucomicrobiota bacterium]